VLNKNSVNIVKLQNLGDYFNEQVNIFLRDLTEEILISELEYQRRGYKQKKSRQRNGYYYRSLVTQSLD